MAGAAGTAGGVGLGAGGLVRTWAFLGARWGTSAGSERSVRAHISEMGSARGSPHPNPNRNLTPPAGQPQTQCLRDLVLQTFLPRQNQP